MVKGMGGAMDLVSSDSKVIVTMEHLAKVTSVQFVIDNSVMPLIHSASDSSCLLAGLPQVKKWSRGKNSYKSGKPQRIDILKKSQGKSKL